MWVSPLFMVDKKTRDSGHDFLSCLLAARDTRRVSRSLGKCSIKSRPRQASVKNLVAPSVSLVPVRATATDDNQTS